MEAPLPHDLPQAYLPDWVDPFGAEEVEEGETRDRATVIADAREERIEDGLPVDDATLERVADAVLSPDYPLPGLHLTWKEVEDDVPEDIERAVDAYLEAHPERDGGARVGWHDGKRTLFVGIVGSDDEVRAAAQELPRDRVVVEPRRRPVVALEALADRIFDEMEELEQAGFRLDSGEADPVAGVVHIRVTGGADGAAAARFFSERYGSDVRIGWLGPSEHREVPQPFGSYDADGRLLRVYYGIDHNGELPGRVRIVEQTPERVVVGVTKRKPVGVMTLIGGFQPQHADLELDEPLGRREVVDQATGAPRPNVNDLR